MRTSAPHLGTTTPARDSDGWPSALTHSTGPHSSTPTGPAVGPAARQLHAVGRLEWEQILRRSRVTGLLACTGRRDERGHLTKGGVSASLFKAVALCIAS